MQVRQTRFPGIRNASMIIHDYLLRPKITIPPLIYDHLSKAAVTIYYCTSTVLMGRVVK